MTLFTWGANSHGQLGLGWQSEQEERPVVVEVTSSNRLISLVMFAMALSSFTAVTRFCFIKVCLSSSSPSSLAGWATQNGCKNLTIILGP